MSEYTDVVYKMEDCIKFTSEDCDARVMRSALTLLKKYREGLEDIEVYWNRDQNEKAMADALWHILDVVEGVLDD